MSEGFTIANFRHVADGLQAGQFAVGERRKAAGLADLDPIYRDLLDRPIAVIVAVIGADGRPGLTPMWFDYEGDTIYVNTATHRSKCQWIRDNPQLSMILVNPDNPYHWMSMKVTVVNEVLETGPDGARVTAQIDKIWRKYVGEGDTYGLRDPSIDEKRVLFECRIDRIATFGKP